MSTRTELSTQVKDIIADQLDVAAERITEQSAIIDDLGADSLAVVELVLALEERFALSIPDEEAEKIRTVADVISYIEAHVPRMVQAAEAP